MSQEIIIFTPEAIAERIFDDWKDRTCHLYLSCFTHQLVDLEQGRLYYLAIGVEDLDEDSGEVDFFDYHFDAFDSIIKEYGQYNRIGVLAKNDSGNILDKMIVFNSAALYLQKKDVDLENHVWELFEGWLPSKLLKNKSIEIRYHSDKSNNWNYHDKTDKPIMHVYLIPKKKASKKSKILDSTFNLR